MKKIKFLFPILFAIIAFSCEKMEDNYAQYLENVTVYSPRVSNLTAQVGLKTATLMWTNPASPIAKKIFIDYGDQQVTLETMQDSYVLENLEIKAYIVAVYTLDEFGNRSVPEKIQIFPNGEE